MSELELLTDRQKQVLAFMANHVVNHQRCPTYSEIAIRFGFSSPNAAKDHVHALRRKGYVEKDGKFNRIVGLHLDAFYHIVEENEQV